MVEVMRLPPLPGKKKEVTCVPDNAKPPHAVVAWTSNHVPTNMLFGIEEEREEGGGEKSRVRC